MVSFPPPEEEEEEEDTVIRWRGWRDIVRGGVGAGRVEGGAVGSVHVHGHGYVHGLCSCSWLCSWSLDFFPLS